MADRLVSIKDGRIIATASRGETAFDVMLATLRQD